MTSLYRNSKMVSAPVYHRILQKFHSHHYHHCYGTFQSHTVQCHCRLFPGHDGDLSPLVKKTGWSPSPGHGYGDICFLRRWRWIFFLGGDVDGYGDKKWIFLGDCNRLRWRVTVIPWLFLSPLRSKRRVVTISCEKIGPYSQLLSDIFLHIFQSCFTPAKKFTVTVTVTADDKTIHRHRHRRRKNIHRQRLT